MQVDQDGQGEQSNEEGKAPGSNSKVLMNKILLDTPSFTMAHGPTWLMRLFMSDLFKGWCVS